MDWDSILFIENEYSKLDKNIVLHKGYVGNPEIFEQLQKDFKEAKRFFVSATIENILDEEMIRISNWCEYISKFMTNLAAFTEGELAGYEFRKITRQDLENKYKNINTPYGDGLSSVKALKTAYDNINNNISFTLLFKDDEYTEKFTEVQQLLKAKKMLETIKIRNMWNNQGTSKGILTLVRCQKEDKEYIFELQFHTMDSLNVKDSIKKYQEIVTDIENFTLEERKKANNMQYKISELLEAPPGALDIQNYGI